MKTVSTDKLGRQWEIVWGTSNPDVEIAEFASTTNIRATGERLEFVEPLYGETKTLEVYETIPSDGVSLALSEITPGVYAVGRKI